MVYITGDIHGDPMRIYVFAKKHKLTKNDMVIILGDVGANYYGDERDERTKENLSKVRVPILCIHGNHEMRPWEADGYTLVKWNGGKVWVQEKYPQLLFAKDGEIYTIDGKRYIAIGGAYSVDSYWRIKHHAGWWESEQPTEEIKKFVEKQLQVNEIDIILSHTCPRKYEPIEAFLPFIDQSSVDTSTEDWLDSIEETVNYQAWYCGHWHINKRIDKMHFL
jgi:3-oxoacid CoA-transferase subunit A